MKTKILTLTFGMATLVLTACPDAAVNTNTNVRNANTNNNVAIVVNNNSNMVNNNTNRPINGNISRDEYDKNRAEYEKDKGDSKIGTGANDGWIWFKTRAALLTTDDLRESTINVDVENGVITLRGTVENAAQKTKAGEVANGIEGKSSVKNDLKVAPKDSMTNQAVNGNTNTRSNANANR